MSSTGVASIPAPPPEPSYPAPVLAFIVAFFVYELLYVLGAFSTQYFFLLGESHRAISLGLLIVLTLLLRRARAGASARIPWYDYVLMVAGAVGCFYIAPTAKIIELQTASPIIGTFELTARHRHAARPAGRHATGVGAGPAGAPRRRHALCDVRRSVSGRALRPGPPVHARHRRGLPVTRRHLRIGDAPVRRAFSWSSSCSVRFCRRAVPGVSSSIWRSR